MPRGGLRAIVVVAAAAAIVQAGIIAAGQMATADRVQGSGWWPTKGTAPRSDYAGAAACTPCHRTQAATQPSTSMARTASRAERSAVLSVVPRLAFSSGGYSYEIASNAQRSLYTVSDGTHASSAPLAWAFGVGKVGQSFLFNRDGVFHEARVSYYESSHALGFTPGRAVTTARGVGDAMSRRVDDMEIRRCFACHTTAPTAQGKFEPSNAIPGITCEACHGPGRRHVEAMQQTRSAGGDAPLLNPSDMKPAESIDFCGACHATFWDITLAGEKGLPALRSQPYRLQSSRCWTTGDVRLTCIACHDPHSPLAIGARAYDDRCLSCHAPSVSPVTSVSSVVSGFSRTSVPPVPSALPPSRTARVCPVATSACPGCHMPKYEVPEMHHEFTDHLIRVVPRSR